MPPFGLPWRRSKALGPLETQVMERVWEGPGPVSVREVHECLGGELAYTTVMTTLDRLFKKGLLKRRREGRGFLYVAAVTRDNLSRGVAGAVVEALLGGEPAARPILSGDRGRRQRQGPRHAGRAGAAGAGQAARGGGPRTVSYWLLVGLLVGAAYGLGSALGSLLAAAAWRLSGSLRRLSGARGARLLLALRAFPAVCGLTVALLLAAPAFVAHEPMHGEHHEEVGPGLVALGLLGLLPSRWAWRVA